MGIEKIDKNFALNTTSFEENGMEYYSIPHESFDLYGVFYEEATHAFMRLPKAVAQKISEGVDALSGNTSGGRLRFSTDSKKLEIRVGYEVFYPMSHMTLVGQSGFILLEETDEGRRMVKILPPQYEDQKGYIATAELKGGQMRNYILFFPLYNDVSSLTVGLEKGAQVGKGKAYRPCKPILYYGSSITQGGCATRPDNCYQALIEKWNNVDFVNLGFSGNAMGEDEMTDYLAGIDCSVFVCDYDYNAPDVAHLKKTHYRLYERYRKVRPDTPILFISKPDIWGEEDEPLRLKVIRQTYAKARRNGDKNVYFLLGNRLFGADWENCTVDGCHPNDLGFYRMAEKIYKKLCEIDSALR